VVPGIPRGLVTVVRVIVGAVPTVLLVLVGVLILLIGFFFGPGRQGYALKAARCAFGTARALVGLTTERDRK
jgi:hypothetical protein